MLLEPAGAVQTEALNSAESQQFHEDEQAHIVEPVVQRLSVHVPKLQSKATHRRYAVVRQASDANRVFAKEFLGEGEPHARWSSSYNSNCIKNEHAIKDIVWQAKLRSSASPASMEGKANREAKPRGKARQHKTAAVQVTKTKQQK